MGTKYFALLKEYLYEVVGRKMLREIWGQKKEEITVGWRKMHN
jgi:hypothetical protein